MTSIWLAYTVRDRLLHRWLNTIQKIKGVKIVGYLSAEFLMGPQLGNNLINLGIDDQMCQAVTEGGLELGDLIEQERRAWAMGVWGG